VAPESRARQDAFRVEDAALEAVRQVVADGAEAAVEGSVVALDQGDGATGEQAGRGDAGAHRAAADDADRGRG